MKKFLGKPEQGKTPDSNRQQAMAESPPAVPVPASSGGERSPPPALQMHLAALLADGFVPITPNIRRPNFTSALDGEMRCYFSAARKKIVTFVYFGDLVQGPPGIVHGGAVFTVVDMSLAICVSRVCQRLGFTANIAINYRSPARLRDWIVVDAAVERVEKEKKVFMTFTAKRIECSAAAAVAPPEQAKEGENRVGEAPTAAALTAAPAATEEFTVVDGTSLFILDLAVPAGL